MMTTIVIHVSKMFSIEPFLAKREYKIDETLCFTYFSKIPDFYVQGIIADFIQKGELVGFECHNGRYTLFMNAELPAFFMRNIYDTFMIAMNFLEEELTSILINHYALIERAREYLNEEEEKGGLYL